MEYFFREESQLLSKYIMGDCIKVIATWIGNNMEISISVMEQYVAAFI